ncbi:MAG TPA: pyruvate dehydrogenase (acetyl-transferring), homodimeric type [Flavobacteriales bacterium]|nr:pyruvate dehydrogenase (acetyl-transferring), homodimeric type [Flavobacteriales bacterium]
MSNDNLDIDPVETQEWLDALASVVRFEGIDRAEYLLMELNKYAQQAGSTVPTGMTAAYANTIAPEDEEPIPEDEGVAKKLRSLIRWNAVAMVIRGGMVSKELGGHIATYSSAADLYEVGFNHFFRARSKDHPGDLIYIQGHSSPGIYARAFLEGRISEKQLDNFRQEVDGEGIPSYPHPWLMKDFWQFPTVSMGLGPLQAIYQARFLKYLDNRGLQDGKDRKVWAYLGDGEMDEPESLGAISIAVREKLDNLIFVVNCNLQRLDGPVRGNGKIIQELAGVFGGAGWNVIKVVWGRRWDPLLSKDKTGLLLKRMQECVDGDYQRYKSRDGAHVREDFFGKYPELLDLVEGMGDDEIWRLNRGGHDAQKIYAAYHEATNHKGAPTVILAKTIKGFGMGSAGEAQNATHQQKKMNTEELRQFCKWFKIDIPDDTIKEVKFHKPSDSSPEIQFLHKQRKALGGYLPSRNDSGGKLKVPKLEDFAVLLNGMGDKEISTTMAFVRILGILLKDNNIKERIVPIVPDESRTFGMEGLFRQIGIYSPVGQLYKPVDREQLMYYKEDKKGQLLEEGISEAGGFASWMAAGSSYANSGLSMIPFFIYYSMFGFQRVGDLAWAAGDLRVRGFLLGATAGRTTLAGEGLQHDDGQSHLFSSVIPNCISYDPTYAYELAVIIQNGMCRMYDKQEDVYFYITVMNENYLQPAMPKDVEEGILKGMYLLRAAKKEQTNHVQLMGSGSILREVEVAAEILEKDFSVTADIWSVTSFTELCRDGNEIDRYNKLHPKDQKRTSYIEACMAEQRGPVVAATDYVKMIADQVRQYVLHPYYVLGTDGFGKSDTRKKLRHHFEVDAKMVAYTALCALVDQGEYDRNKLPEALIKLGIDPDKSDPFLS